jgi:TRAP-type C4-dicarboxylate transport system substrate-binding protein
MNKRHWIVFVIALALLAISLPACSKQASTPASTAVSTSTPAAEKVTLRLVIPNPPGDKLTVAAEDMGKRLSQRTNGQYEIKVYPGEQLAKIPEYVDAVRTDVVEMFNAGWGIYAGIDPRLAEIPMQYNNVRANAAATREITALYDQVFEQKLNQKALACFTTAALEVESKKPIKTMADWKGLLIGAINPECAALASSLGAAPTTVMWTDCYEALSKGVIDACFNSTQWTIIGSLFDVSHYVVRFYAIPTFLGYNINLDVWNKMPKNVQDILVEEAWTAAGQMNDAHIKAETEDKDILIGKGMEVYDVPAAERDAWRQAVAPYVNKKLTDMGDFGTQMQNIADKANSANP